MMKRSVVIPGFGWINLAGLLFLGKPVIAESSGSPLSPQGELATLHFANENLIAELVTAEPDVVAPVAIAWDADGRLFVAEMTDYPSGPVSGRIRMLEDRDGDGRYEHSTVFADEIAFPNGVMPWNGGVLVTAAPDILFLRDTDGDGRADERRVLLSGFAEGNQQLRANGLYWGIDNWIYGANGRSDGEVRWVTATGEPPAHTAKTATQPRSSAAVNSPSPGRSPPPSDRRGVRGEGEGERGERQGEGGRSDTRSARNTELDSSVHREAGRPAPSDKVVSIRRRDFRFRPSTGQFEAIAGHSQFGTAHDDWGNRFPVFNNIPIRHVVLEQRYLDRQTQLAGIETVVPISTPGDLGRVYYLAPPTLLIPQASDYFTSACGPTVYRGDALGVEYRGSFFVCEPVHNLIQRRRLVPKGATFIAERTESGKDFLASTDPWFHPVFTTTGPDGALYVVDFYRKYVEHPHWVADELKNTTPWRTGEQHGRIWRIRAKDWKLTGEKPNLSRAKSRALVKSLNHENGWWRDTAQRLLVERQDRSVAAALGKLARNASSPLARLHALYTLDGLNLLSPDMLSAALKDPQPEIREHSIRLAEQFVNGPASVPERSDLAHGQEPDEPERNDLGGSANAKSRSVSSTLQKVDMLRNSLFAATGDSSPRVRFQLALTLGEIGTSSNLKALASLAQGGSVDHWQSLAILTSLEPRPWLLWQMIADQNRDWFKEPGAERAWFVEALADLIAGSRAEEDLRDCAAALGQDQLPSFGKMVLLGALMKARKSNHLIVELLAAPGPGQSAGKILAEAEQAALSPERPLTSRLAALRLLGRGPSPGISRLAGLLSPENPAEVQAGAVNAVSESNDPVAAGLALDGWERYTKSTRHQLVAASARSSALADGLLTALERGTIRLIEIDPSTRQALQRTSNPELNRRAEKLFKGAVSPDRDQVLQRFKPALNMTGDRRHGAELFAKTCLQCHAMQGEGNRVGPDLSGIASQPKETMLMNILDPSRQVLPDFVSYTVVPAEGEPLTGLIAAESAASVTLRRPNLPDVTLQRNAIRELRVDGKSLMPDGLEEGLTLQDMADLLSFLRQPDAALLPKE